MTSPDLLNVADLSIRFKTRNGEIEALRNLNLTVAEGEVLGIVGESGSGKSVTLRAILGLLPDSARISGRIVFNGNDLLASDKRVYERIRGRDITFVAQNPADSFNPSLSVGYHLTRLLRIRGEEHQSRQDRRAAAEHLLSRVKVDPAGALERYPFGFSQGQLQRIMVAMAALIGKPKLLLADEPTTSLDVTTEAQLISLIAELQAENGLAVIFVSHDIAAIARIAGRIAVMYGGAVVEQGPAQNLLSSPAHPYTIGLLKSSRGSISETGGRLYSVPGAPPDVSGLRGGCAFAPRCSWAVDTCHVVRPVLRRVETSSEVACHRAADILAETEEKL